MDLSYAPCIQWVKSSEMCSIHDTHIHLSAVDDAVLDEDDVILDENGESVMAILMISY